MKNSTRFRSLDVVESDARVVRVYQDSDGLWMDLAYGFTADPLSAHDIHEMTVRDVLGKYKRIQPCKCQPCADELSRIACKRIGGPATRELSK